MACRFGLALTLLGFPALSSAATLDVCTTGCAYDSIGGALNAAESGDTITVSAGTWDEALTITVDVDIVGAGSTVTEIIGSPSASALVTFTDPTASLSGFTVTPETGRAVEVSAITATLSDIAVAEATVEDEGAALRILDESVVTLSDAVLDSNEADLGGHIAVLDGGLLLESVSLSSGSARYGGAIWVEADPLFDDFVEDGLCGDALTTSCESPAIDAGDPEVEDPDGSRADIGRYGGPYAPEWMFADSDADSYRGGCECDDSDPHAYPDAEEVPYAASTRTATERTSLT